jgi:hypothetical protein
VGAIFIALKAQDREDIEALAAPVGIFSANLDQLGQAANVIGQFGFVLRRLSLPVLTLLSQL